MCCYGNFSVRATIFFGPVIKLPRALRTLQHTTVTWTSAVNKFTRRVEPSLAEADADADTYACAVRLLRESAAAQTQSDLQIGVLNENRRAGTLGAIAAPIPSIASMATVSGRPVHTALLHRSDAGQPLALGRCWLHPQ